MNHQTEPVNSNVLIESITADTLNNISSVLKLLSRFLSYGGDLSDPEVQALDDKEAYGLGLIFDSMTSAIDYEVSRLPPNTSDL